MTEALIGFAVMLGLMALRVPLAIAMAVVGFVGMGIMRTWPAAIASTSQVVFETGSMYLLSVVPLFILMGNLVTRAGMSRELFQLAYTFIGHLRGGLAMSTVTACAGFGAICGSSIATAATMSKVAYPPMKKLGYSDSLSAAAISAGGTLGIMIPPSTVFVLYGIITDVNIGKLFAAGILPGILCATLMCIAIYIVALRNPTAAPAGPRSNWKERFAAIKDIWAVVALFVLVMGGIYGGIFTATEGAGIGAFGGFCFALARRALTWRTLLDTLAESARTTAMIFTILIGAMIFSNFMNFTTFPNDLKDFVVGLNVSPIWIVVAICIIYVLLGMVMEELAIVLLTVPIFFPLVTSLGFDGVWFGVLIVMVVMLGLITPPVGLNLFVVNTLLPQVGLKRLYSGIWPFVYAQLVCLAVLIFVPQLSMFLANRVG
ncbi:MAG: TRAP transporter large permease [Burkholderiaceae bacterium]